MAYDLDGQRIDSLPAGQNAQARVKPIYQTFEGWTQSTRGARSWSQLPAQAVKYVRHVEELIGLGQLGYIRAIQVKLDEIGTDYPEHADFVTQMRSLIDRFDLDQYMATLKTLHSYDH